MPTDYEEAAKMVHAEFVPVYLARGELPTQRALLEKGNVSDLVLGLLPTTIAQVQVLLEHGLEEAADGPELSASSSTVMARAIALHTASARRTPEWIRANGVCVEHLVAQPSTIPYAGQGAFAQHVIRAGEVVVPVPLLQVLDRDGLRMTANNHDDGQKTQMDQLLLNYCLGHADSSMLLCPMTNAALINHASSATAAADNNNNNQKATTPNAVFQWHESSESLLNRTVDEFWSGNGRGLRMDVIATRDIAIGEEVLVDYGPAWDAAWREHLQKDWSGPLRYSTEELNEQKAIPDRFLSHDLRKQPVDDSYIVTGCQYYVTGDEDRPDYHPEDDFDWRDLDDEELLRRYSNQEDGWYTVHYEYHHDKSHWPCTVIRLTMDEEGNDSPQQEARYLVRIHQHSKKDETSWEEHGVPRFLREYPRSSIHFFTKPYATDQLLAGAFRHPIGIPDAMFPAAWKNRPRTAAGPVVVASAPVVESEEERQVSPSQWAPPSFVIEPKGVTAATAVQTGP
jgi:hypothetical protein